MFLVGRGFVDALFIGDTRRLARGSRRWRAISRWRAASGLRQNPKPPGRRGLAERSLAHPRPARAPSTRAGAMPLVKSADAPEEIDPVRCAPFPAHLSRSRAENVRDSRATARTPPPLDARARAPPPRRASVSPDRPPRPPRSRSPPAPPSFSQVGRDLRPGAVDGPLAKRRTPDAREPGRPGARRALAPGRRPPRRAPEPRSSRRVHSVRVRAPTAPRASSPAAATSPRR